MSVLANRSVFWVPIVAAVACGQGFRPGQYPDPMALLEASKAAYRRGDCEAASAGFQRLTFEMAARDPLQAELRYYLAECDMRNREYVEAARQFRRVANEFPQHALAPDGLLRAGDAYAELWKRPALDPTYGENALSVWRELQNRYSQAPAADRARLRIQDLNEMFAEKAYKNGDFYYRFGAYDSAIIYFQDVVANYPGTSFAPRAVVKLIATYDRIGYQEEKREMCGYLQQYYPLSLPQAEACAAAATP